jgi:hypothetical protein
MKQHPDGQPGGAVTMRRGDDDPGDAYENSRSRVIDCELSPVKLNF